MAFKPDIVVLSGEGPPSLVVDVKADARAADASQLKRYMANMSIPLGATVSPTTFVLYRDTYRGTAEESVQEIGRYPIEGVLPAATNGATPNAGEAELAFERDVQRWLEQLAIEGPGQALSPDLRRAVTEHVMPLLREGEIRAGGPRWRRTGS